MDTTDAFLKVVHAMEYCERESRRAHWWGWHRQGYYEFKRVLQEQWGTRLEVPWHYIGPEEMAETVRGPDFYKKFFLGEWLVRQRVVNAVFGDIIERVPKTAVGALLLEQAVRDDVNNRFVPGLTPGKGPHVLTARNGEQAYCGGPGLCGACDLEAEKVRHGKWDGRSPQEIQDAMEAKLDEANAATPSPLTAHDGVLGVTLEVVLSWKERTGYMAAQVFGRRGAHCSEKTYEELRRRCQVRTLTDVLTVRLDSFRVHVREGVPDGVLQRCDCGEKEEKTNV